MSLTAHALELRRRKITGTTAAAILGEHPYKTPHAAWMEILGLSTVEPSEAMAWGLRLQSLVGDEFARRHTTVLEELETVVHPALPWLACTGDYRDLGNPRVLVECKTAGERQVDRWGDSGSDSVPVEYLLQSVIQGACYDADVVWICVLLSGREYREYPIERNRDLEAAVLERLAEFHAAYIATEQEPPGTPADRIAYLESRYPKNDGIIREAPPEALQYVERWRAAREALRWAERETDEAKAALCALIGENDGIAGPEWRATWKAPKPSTVVDWRGVAIRLGATEEQIRAATTYRENGRRFLLKILAEGKDE